MSIVTKTGDNGDTGLVGGGRIPKSDVRLHAYGTVDELNAFLGAVLASLHFPLSPDPFPPRGQGESLRPVPPSPVGEGLGVREHVQRLQHLLFRLGADLASPATVKNTKRIGKEHTEEIEGWIRELESALPPLTQFILPGGTRAAAQLHVARTVCRRAERWTVALSEFEDVNREAIVFLNRLSDYLFLAAREMNRAAGAEEAKVIY
ncbi:MAG: cob(I)yrinic acid a,c-diamide adenosyltransferase [Candidatus Peribacteraceae bacterium]|nr:cob(I)yrinic acid a,c-diamide adenosyltransferase [Candidatus Peribacteraceae bacterium]